MERSVGSLTIPNLVDEIIAQVSSARDLEEEEGPSVLQPVTAEALAPATANEQTGARLVA
jgi:hypothetical protein